MWGEGMRGGRLESGSGVWDGMGVVVRMGVGIRFREARGGCGGEISGRVEVLKRTTFSANS